MVKRGSPVLHPRVSKVQHEFNDGGDPSWIFLEFRDSVDIRIKVLEVGVEEVCTASIELNNFLE